MIKKIVIILNLAITIACGTEPCDIKELEGNYWITYENIMDTCGLDRPDGHVLRLGNQRSKNECIDYRSETSDSCIVNWERDCNTVDLRLANDTSMSFEVINGETIPIDGRSEIRLYDKENNSSCYTIFKIKYRKLQ